MIRRKFVLLCCLMTGCVTTQDGTPPETFNAALVVCRKKQPVDGWRRHRLPAWHPGVSQCLKGYGWNSDGSRS